MAVAPPNDHGQIWSPCPPGLVHLRPMMGLCSQRFPLRAAPWMRCSFVKTRCGSVWMRWFLEARRASSASTTGIASRMSTGAGMDGSIMSGYANEGPTRSGQTPRSLWRRVLEVVVVIVVSSRCGRLRRCGCGLRRLLRRLLRCVLVRLAAVGASDLDELGLAVQQ